MSESERLDRAFANLANPDRKATVPKNAAVGMNRKRRREMAKLQRAQNGGKKA